jgi:hypothetical protein
MENIKELQEQLQKTAQIANQLSVQNEQLRNNQQELLQKLEQLNLYNAFKRIDYLFAVTLNPSIKELNPDMISKAITELDKQLFSPEVEEVTPEVVE